jgi:hypothetical protein
MTKKAEAATKSVAVKDRVVQELVTTEPVSKQMANSIDMASSLQEKRLYAVQMIQSGLLPASLASPIDLEDDDTRDKAIGAVIAVVEYGREMGVTPWVALHGMHVVQGKVVMGIHIFLGMALKNNILVDVVEDFKSIKTSEGKTGNYITTVEITRKYKEFDGLVKTYTFSKRWSEIKKAGLDQRDNYQKRPIAMLRTRCITEALRLYAADIYMGTYETSEMLDVTDVSYTIDDDGNVTS